MQINPDDSILVIYKQPGDRDLTFAVNRNKGYQPENFGMLICYLVDHVAGAFKVSPDVIWKAVESAKHSS